MTVASRHDRERTAPRRCRTMNPLAAVAVAALAVLAAGCAQAVPPGTASSPSVRPAIPHATKATSAPARPSTSHPTPPSTPTPSAPSNPAGLTDERMVGQLFMAYLYGSSATDATYDQQQANLALYGVATAAEAIRRWHLGGVLLIDHNTLDPQRPYLSTGNVNSAGQIAALTAGLQQTARADSGEPLLIATDQEGGEVQRITDGVSWRPSELSIANDGSQALTCGYASLGRQLLALGVNQDFAPVADVVRTSGGVIGNRSFGPDPQLDAQDVVAAVRGLQSAGVLATLKHWPGHGSTATDSHAALAVIEQSVAQWQSIDRVPFAAAANQVAAVMVGHLALPAIDPSNQPATLSPTLINGLLRNGLGFRGLVVTDSLWMEPAMNAGTPGQVAVASLSAGADMLLMSPDVGSAYRTVLARVKADPTFRTVVQAAAARVLAAKARIGVTAPVVGC